MGLVQERRVAAPLSTKTIDLPESQSTTVDRTRHRPRALPELLLVVALWIAYSLGRLVADGHVTAAFHNADRVWHLERMLHLPSEATVQRLALHSETLVRTANIYYAFVHFPMTAAFLLWLYLRRPAYYLSARRALAILTAAALVGHLLFPLAPPRMVANFDLVDTGYLYGPSVYGPPKTDRFANEYAAMPSLHVGWAVIVAIVAIRATRSRWRWLWPLYPATTLAVVITTANHYWLDGIVACAMVAVIVLAMRPARRSRDQAAEPPNYLIRRIPAQRRVPTNTGTPEYEVVGVSPPTGSSGSPRLPWPPPSS